VAISKNNTVMSNVGGKMRLNASTTHTISKLHELSDEEDENNQPDRDNQLVELEESVQSDDETEYIENININYFQIRNKTTVKNVQMNSSKASSNRTKGVNRIEQSTTSSSVTWEMSPKKRTNANRQPLLK
jgi:hypothetical protein